jgi:hypothetical protein
MLNCCISDEMDGREDEEESGNNDSECDTEDNEFERDSSIGEQSDTNEDE